MLGSDYPFPLGEAHPGKLIDSVGFLDAGAKARLLGENALEFFDTKLATFRPS